MNIQFFQELQRTFSQFPQTPKLVAVTKYSNISEINEAIQQGVERIGENRIEVLEEKLPDLLPVEKHFIGVLQTKKLRRIVKIADVIQSVASLEHLEKINIIAKEEGKVMRVFLQINISGESQKSGFAPSELLSAIQTIPQFQNLKVEGIMGMAEHTENEMDIRMQFRLAKRVFEDMKKEIPSIKELSLGMSGDFLIALEEGSTMVRIGSALFNN